MNIRDIAKLAGVSAATVSKVMNGKDKDISETTKQKVLKIIQETDYVPYLKFREKEGMKNRLLGLVVQKQNRECNHIVVCTETAVKQQGYSLVVRYADSDEEIEEAIKEFGRLKVTGVLVDSEKWQTESRFRDSSVYLCHTSLFDEKQKRTFYYRLAETGELAVNRLVKEGHQNIACITLKKDKSIQEGYRIAMQKVVPVQSLWTYEGDSLEDIKEYGLKQCLSENITAVICGSEAIACYVYQRIEQSRMSVPRDFSLISIGNGEIVNLLGNGVSSVRFPIAEMCKEAVAYLLNMIRDDKDVEIARRFSPTVVDRKSIAEPVKARRSENIIVVGTMNMDITVEVSRTPVKGETQLAEKVYMFPGGKGANQAVGVGKLGGQVYMIGRIGKDRDGKQLYSSLAENHVHMDGVMIDSSLSSGKAYINVDKTGESTIVVYPGANQNLSIAQIKNYEYLFHKAKYCLLSMEIPALTAEYTIKMCKRNNTQIIVKPSATEQFKDEWFKYIDYFIPNEQELHKIVQKDMSLEEKAEFLRMKGVSNVIVTLGAKGCYLKNETLSMYFEGTGFEPVDTTGGADSFISALAVYLSEGSSLASAIGFAVYASGLSVMKYGVQPALPERRSVDIFEDEVHAKYGDLDSVRQSL